MDNWLDLGYPIYQKALIAIDKEHLSTCVQDFVTNNEDWNWGMLKILVLTDIIPKILSIFPLKEDACQDKLVQLDVTCVNDILK